MGPELTKEQENAKKSLERALKKCAAANLHIYGMSNSLCSYNGFHLDSVELTDTGALGHGVIPYEEIMNYGAYKDSGADDPWQYAEQNEWSD